MKLPHRKTGQRLLLALYCRNGCLHYRDHVIEITRGTDQRATAASDHIVVSTRCTNCGKVIHNRQMALCWEEWGDAKPTRLCVEEKS